MEDTADRAVIEVGRGVGGEPDDRPEHVGEAVDLFGHLGALELEVTGFVGGLSDSFG